MSYLGVFCRRCGEHIPMAPDDPSAPKSLYVPDSIKDEPMGVFCPFCGFSARYRRDELKSEHADQASTAPSLRLHRRGCRWTC